MRKSLSLVFLGLLIAPSAFSDSKTKSSEERIITIGGSISEIACALDACDKIIAVDTSSTFPTSLEKLPKIGYARNLSAEGLVSFKPTLVILDQDAGPPHVIQKLEAMKIPMAKVNNGTTVADTKLRIQEIAAALKAKDKGDKLVADFEAKIAGLEKFKAEKVKKKVLFVYARGGKHIMVAGDKTPVSTLFELMGVENAMKGMEGFKPLTAEAVAAAKPDVILMTESGAESLGGKEGVLSLPGVKLTPAGEKKAVLLDNDLRILTIGPRTGEVVEALHAQLGTKG